MNLFLTVLLIVAGYILVLGIVLSRADDRRAVSSVATGVLLIYGSVIVMIVFAGEYLGNVGIILYAAAIVYSCFYLIWKCCSLFRKRQRSRPHLAELFTLLAYILAVLYVTIFMRTEGSGFEVQMQVLDWLRHAGRSDTESFQHVLQNIALFVPVGILSPLVTDGIKGKFLSGMSLGMALSAAIETGQLVFRSGTCDIDDIIANTIGAAVGAGLAVIWKRRQARKQK